MKILYLHQYFRTPEEGGAIRSYHIAKAMAKAGHEVTLISAHNHEKRVEKSIEGFKVIYLPIFYSNEFSFSRRVKSYLRFATSAVAEAKKLQQIDVVFATSTPLTVGYAALKIKRPYVFEIRDLWPKIPIELGYINPVVGYFFKRLERKIYTKAHAIISLAPETSAHVNRLGFGSKSYFIPNMSDCHFFQMAPPNNDFTVCYTGTFGVANRLEYLIDSAKMCFERKLPVKFILIGEGKEFQHIRFLCRNLPNVEIEAFSDKARMKRILEQSHAAYISFLDHSALRGMSPNKFFDALAAGKLVIVNSKGWLKDYVKEQMCGFYHNPHSAEDFVHKITPFLHDRAMLAKHQQKARICAERDFSTDYLTGKILNIIDTISTSDDSAIR